MKLANPTPRIAELRASAEPTGIALVDADDLPELAHRINESVEGVANAATSMVAHALEAGSLLNQAKARVAHGDWETWLAANCTVAPRTAQAYMRLAKHIPSLPQEKRNAVADMPLREVIRAISTSPDKPPRYPSIRVDKKDDVERTVAALRKSASAIRDAAKQIELIHELKGTQVLALRNKLLAAIEALDRLAPVYQEDGGAS